MDVRTLKQSIGTWKLSAVPTCCNCCTSRTRLIDVKCSRFGFHPALLNLVFNWYNDLPIFLVCKLPSNECVVWMVIPHHGIWIGRKPVCIKNRIPAVQPNLHQRKGNEWITIKVLTLLLSIQGLENIKTINCGPERLFSIDSGSERWKLSS